MKLNRYSLLAVMFLAICAPLCAQLEVQDQYWFREKSNGQTLWLGGHGITNLISQTKIDIAAHNAHYAACGANTLRLHLTQGALGDGAPWKQLGDSRYDLGQWNERWWERLKEFMDDCRGRGIYPFVQLWDEPVIESGPTRWQTNPWRPSNNVNQLSGLDDGPDGNGLPGFYDVSNEKLMALQTEFVRRVLDLTAPYGICIYSICNEYDYSNKAPLDWQTYWIKFFQEYERYHPELPAPLLYTNTAVSRYMQHGAPDFPVIDWYYLGPEFRMKSFSQAGEDQSGTSAAVLHGMVQKVRELFPGKLLLNSRPSSSPDRGTKDFTNEDETRRIAWTFFTSAVHLGGFRHLNPAGPGDTEPWLRADPDCVQCSDGLATERALGSVHNFIMLARPDLATMVPEYDENGGSPVFRLTGRREQVIYLPEGGNAEASIMSCCDEVFSYDPRDPGAGLRLRDRSFGSSGWLEAGDRETVFLIVH